MTLSIAPLALEEIDTLCELARTVWRQHYPPLIGSAQTEYMLAERYKCDVIREELARGGVWWDVLRDDGSMIAFASSFRVDRERALKLDKLYVHPALQRLGYGGMLLEHVCERAARMGDAKVMLAVNKRNATAIAAYRKHGFKIAQALVKDIGGGFVMDDYIMVKRIGGESREAQADAP